MPSRIVRRGTKDRPRFYLRYKDVDGVERMKAAKGARTKGEARDMLTAIDKRIMDGKVGIERPTEEQIAKRSLTVEQLGEKFTDTFSSPKIKNPADYRMEAKSVLKRIYPALGKRAAASVTSLDVEQLRDKLATEKYKPQTITNTLMTLSKLYGWGKKQGYIDCDNPVRGVERAESEALAPITTDKFLSKKEVAQLFEHVDELAIPGIASEETIIARVMLYTAIFAGLRKGELFGLTWSAIEFDRKQIEVSRSYDGKTKSGKTRHVPLSKHLKPILKAWKEVCPKVAGDLVFPVEGRMGQAYETLGLAELLTGAGCHEPPKVWHGLRHTFASHFIMAGGNILTLQKLLGHSDIQTTMIYAHLAPEFMAAEVDRLAFARTVAGVTPITAATSA
jgi:integrase